MDDGKRRLLQLQVANDNFASYGSESKDLAQRVKDLQRLN